MRLHIDMINADAASCILNWKYEKPYDFYNNEFTLEALNEMLSSSFFSVFDRDMGLIGFFCVGISAQVPNEQYSYSKNFIDFGLGMKPELTGKGYGATFVKIVLCYINETYGNKALRLTVAKFNQRAIRLYEKFGFRQETQFTKGHNEFIVMLH